MAERGRVVRQIPEPLTDTAITTLEQDFGELRSLPTAPDDTANRTRDLFALLVAAREANPSSYEEQWLPYLADERERVPHMLHTVTNLEDLEPFVGLLPFPALVLDASESRLRDKKTAALAASPLLREVGALYLWHNTIKLEGAEALASSEHLAGLRSLYLGHNRLRNEGAAAIAASPHLANLRTLDLRGNDLGDEAAEAIAASTRFTHVTALILTENWIGPRGVEALLNSPNLPALTSLHLGSNALGDIGARVIASSPGASRLTRLGLSGNRIGDEGAAYLAESPHLAPELRDAWMR